MCVLMECELKVKKVCLRLTQIRVKVEGGLHPLVEALKGEIGVVLAGTGKIDDAGKLGRDAGATVDALKLIKVD